MVFFLKNNMEKDIIAKLKESNLLGRSGSGFPVWLKWEMVKNAQADLPTVKAGLPADHAGKKYIVCNAAEGEPFVSKDGFILENYPEEMINGIKIALETIDHSTAYLYLRKDYCKKFGKKLKKMINDLSNFERSKEIKILTEEQILISLFENKYGYLAGEETCLCENIEGKRVEPRIRPPFPVQAGLWGCPTLINNVETFYFVSKITKGEYKKTRFYSIDGEAKNKGVFELPENYSISQILKETNNWPDFDPSLLAGESGQSFFVQAGGGACGEILLPDELDQPVKGAGSIIIFNRKKINLISLMKKWVDFFLQENCDKCVPCREGIYRIKELLEKKNLNKETLKDIFFVLEETSFCGLGKGVVTPFKSLIDKFF